MQIDHVILGVQSFDEAAGRIDRELGLDSLDGGWHPGSGTGNRIVPLGPNYVELLGVVDQAEAQRSHLGRHLQQQVALGDRLIGWCMASNDLDRLAVRLGITPTSGSRERPDGTTLRWRFAGLEVAMSEPCLPFFIAWEVPEDQHPGRGTAQHREVPLGIAWVHVSGDRSRIRSWLGAEDPAVRVSSGQPGLLAVGIATYDGEIVLR